MSENTEVVKQLRSDNRLGIHTGSKYQIRKGIFKHQCERVNYICKDCDCEFYQLYRTDEKRSVEVNENIAWLMIGAIVTVLSLFMLIAALSVDDPPVWMALAALLSGLLFATFLMVTLGTLAEILDLD